nr:hypothetical protein [Tanacetum cinerariifolium]
MDNKKHIVNLESFRDMLHVCSRVHGQTFAKPPFKEEILAFIRFLGHSAMIRILTNVNINKLYQPWRSFAAIINKCLTGKSSGYDSLRLSQAQILWKSNAYKEYYAIATRVAPPKPQASAKRTRNRSDTSINPLTTTASPRLTAFAKGKQTAKASKAKSLSALSKGFWVTATIHHHAIRFKMDNKKHIVNLESFRDMLHICLRVHGQSFAEPPFEEEILTFIRPRQTTSQKGKQAAKASKAKKLTNEEIKNSNAYKEYYAIATRAAPPKPKASVQRTRSSSDTTITPPTAAVGADNKGKDSDDDEEDEGDDGEEGDGNDDDYDEDNDGEEGNDDDNDQEVERDDDKDDEEEGGGDDQEFDEKEYAEKTRDEESFDTIPKTSENSKDEGNGMESIFKTTSQMDVHTSTSVAPLPMTAPTMIPSTIATITTTSQAPILPTTRMNEAVKVAVQIQSDRLRDEAQRENDEFLKTVDENMQKIIKEQVKEQVETSYVVAANLFEMELKKILIEKMEGNKSIQRSAKQRNLYKALVEAYESDKIILDTYEETVTLKRRRDDDADKDEEPSTRPDRGSKRRIEGKEPESASAPTETATRSAGRSTQGELAKRSNSRSSFNELMDTPLDFSNFLINRLKVDTLTPELLASRTYELMKGSCKSLVELEYHLEEVFKATTNQLDWVNPEGQQYPHNLLKPLPLIPNNRGRRVISFEYFINNDLEYLREGASSRKYTTITKTKVADYGHIKWIEDLVPRTMWIEEPIGYDKHALWGVSHWGRKRH